MIKVTTDHKWKSFLYAHELTRKERKQFDYMSEEDFQGATFVRYRGCVYNLCDFMRTEHAPEPLSEWHGYASDSYFSGVVIQLSPDCEQYRIGTYIS